MGAYHAKGSSLCAVAGVSQEDIKPGSEALYRSLVLYMCVYIHTYTHTIFSFLPARIKKIRDILSVAPWKITTQTLGCGLTN